MIEWKPIIPKQLQLSSSEAKSQFDKRRIILITIGLIGLIVFLAIPSSSIFFIPIISVLSLLFLLFYFRWRKSFFSYLYYYGGKKWRFDCEDYSWRDSLIMGFLILFGGVIIVGFIFLYIMISNRKGVVR